MFCVRAAILQSQALGDTDNTSAAGHLEHMTVEVKGNCLITRVKGICKQNIIDKLDGGNTLVKSVFYFAFGRNVAGNPFRCQRDAFRDSLGEIVSGITVVPSCQCITVLCGIGRLQCWFRADIDEPLGRDGTASAVQFEADSIIWFGNRAGVFILYAAVEDSAADSTGVCNLTVEDAAADSAGVRNFIVEPGTAVGICAFNCAPGINHSSFNYAAVCIHDIAVIDTVTFPGCLRCSTIFNDAAVHNKRAVFACAIHAAAK